MMYKHKNLKQLLCCVLLLCLFCGSSLGFFSVNAANAIQSQAKFDTIQIAGDSVTCYYSVTTFDPFLEVQSIDYESGNPSSQDNIKSVGQYYVVTCNIMNNTNDIYELPKRYVQMDIEVTTLNSNYKIGYSTVFQNESIDAVEIGTVGAIYLFANKDYVSNNKIVLPPQSYISFSFVFCRHVSRYDGSSMDTSIAGYKATVNNVNIVQPNGATVNNNASIKDTAYNSLQTNQKLDNINNQLVQIYSQISSQNQTIISEQQETNSNITSQTEQQKEQYDAFSANTDSSDSSNISSTISGGTDAVKQKMGLFSFFDGIVSDLSDVLTKNHERHLILPALDVPLPEETVHIWDRKEFDFEELENNFGAILTVVRFATVAICYVTMINGAYHLFHKFIGVKDSDA